MSTLVVKIFDRHLGDMKFQFGGIIIQTKPNHVCLILGLRVSPIANKFLFVDSEHMANFRMRQFPKKKNTYGLKEIDDALKQAKLERHHDDVLRLNLLKIILLFLLPNKGRNVGVKYVDLRNHIDAPAIEPPAVGVPVVSTPIIGSSSTATKIGAVVVRSHGKMLEGNSMSSVRDSTLPLGDTPLLGQYQFSTPDKTAKYKREEEGNEKEDGKRKKVEPRTWQRDLQQKINRLKRRKRISKKGLANRVSRKRQAKFSEVVQSTAENLLQQVAHGEGLEVVKYLVVDDYVEVRMEVNLETISSEYGGGLLKKGDKKDDEDEKDVEKKVKFVEKVQPQVTKGEEVQEMEESKNGDEKVDDVEKDGEGVAKTDIVFFNQEEVIGEAYQTKESKDELEQSKEEKDIDEASQTKESKKEVVEGKDDDDGNSLKKPDPAQVIDMYSKDLIQYFDTQHRTRPDKEKIVLADVFACQYIGKAFNVWISNMSSPKDVELKKKSIWE
ncbi:hypothetical protein GIB67_029408 [Kingdonia uniflora]|uniref:Uncharacterized protein n=1 Tax=Kingdonia uniflora TaxID=39325 RepID=A0A7J7NY20_9MAGN|nr:hypothetical protein GIB67_029408 [Kingdonia uniflora]